MTDLGLEKTYCSICNFEFADALLYYIHEQESHLETAKLSIPSETGTLYYFWSSMKGTFVILTTNKDHQALLPLHKKRMVLTLVRNAVYTLLILGHFNFI
jgi:hypothetical protein